MAVGTCGRLPRATRPGPRLGPAFDTHSTSSLGDDLVDAPSRAIRSGVTSETIRIPDDVRFDASLPQTCRQRAALSTISFFADGMSCGGSIALSRLDMAYEIRVNWLTGRIEIVSRSTLAN